MYMYEADYKNKGCKFWTNCVIKNINRKTKKM